jgi:DNA-binding NarL/FixJ family response regulator
MLKKNPLRAVLTFVTYGMFVYPGGREDFCMDFNHIKLVIADDHLVVRQGLSEMLQKRGKYTVVGQAADGNELLQVLNEQHPDIIIMDVTMPGVDGVTALAEMTRRGMNMPVLVLSANEAERNVRAVLKAGARGFMPKNAGIEELEFAIDSILEGKTYLSPSVTSALMNGDANGNNLLTVLTKRELEIMKHLADGKPNRVIGKMLLISTRTVDTHRSNLLKKLNVKTNAELVKIAISNGLIEV